MYIGSVTFELEVLTPMFMYGANQSEPEIRPSAIKGIIRYWWRILQADMWRSDEGIREMRKKEKQLFGGVGDGSRRSRLKVRVMDIRLADHEVTLEALRKELGEYQKKQDGKLHWKWNYPGVAYLLYSKVSLGLKYTKEKDDDTMEDNASSVAPEYIPPGSRFRVLFEADEEVMRHALAGFWCAVNLGGFGARCRRGAGCVTAYLIEGEQMFKKAIFPRRGEEPKYDNAQALEKLLELGLQEITKFVCGSVQRDHAPVALGIFGLGENAGSWEQALNYIGERYKAVRRNWWRNSTNRYEIAGLGLPLRKGGVKFSIRRGREKTDRYGSPVWIGLYRTGGLLFGRWVCICADLAKWIRFVAVTQDGEHEVPIRSDCLCQRFGESWEER